MNNLEILLSAAPLLACTAIACGYLCRERLAAISFRSACAFKTANAADGTGSGGARTAAPISCDDHRSYPAYLHENSDHTYTVCLRNRPGAFSEGETYEEAEEMAGYLLSDVISGHFLDGEKVPPAAAPYREDPRADQQSLGDDDIVAPNASKSQAACMITLPLDASLKIILHNRMVRSGRTKADLTVAPGLRPRQIEKLLLLDAPADLGILSMAFGALGRDLDVRVI